MSAYSGTVTAKRSLGGLVWFAIVAFLIGLAITAALAVSNTAPATTDTKPALGKGPVVTQVKPNPYQPIVVNGRVCHQCAG